MCVVCLAQGMQRNPGMKTIEGDLHHAIFKAGGISAENADEFNKVSPQHPVPEVRTVLLLPPQ
jgi:hypothetical protein